MKKLLFLLLFLNCMLTCFCQRDTEFWFAAPEVRRSTLEYDRPIFLKLFSYDQPATINVSMPANAAFPVQTIEMNAWESVALDLTTYIDLIENKPENIVLNSGLNISSDNPISAYYEILGYCNCNPEILTLKGSHGLGDDFYVPFQTYLKNGNATDPATAAIDIVATMDGTTISVKATKDLVGHNAEIAFFVFLNRGQTYSLKVASDLPGEHPTGTHITADKPIAITMTDDLLNGGLEYDGYCLNIVADQIIPVSQIGKKYFIKKGNLVGTEKAFVLATQDSTIVSVLNSPDVFLNKGEATSVNIGFNLGLIIDASKPVYVLQITGIGCETSGSIIPPLPQSGLFSAGITRSTSESCFISLLTEQGNQDGFTINGNATLINSSVFNIVPGSQNEYVTATIEFSESILPVNQPFWITNTKGNFQVSMLNGENISGSRFAVFGDYVLDIIEASSQVLTKKQISVYPNPAKNDLILEIERAQYDQPVLILTDLTGKKVKEITLQQNHTQVDLSKFVAGIYLYFIVDQGIQQHSGKIIKIE